MNGFLKLMANKTCLITGASRGLGKLLAIFYSKLGFDLILAASDLVELERVSNELQIVDGQKLLLVKSDFSIEDFDIDMFHEISNFCVSIDLLINNAAIQGPIGPFSDLPFKDWERVFKVNFLAPAAICQKAIWYMMNGGGTIINLSGGGGAGLRPNFSAYGASKAALIRFSETIAAELAHQNINVNTIAPGAMPTDMLQKVLESPDNVVGPQEKKSAMEAFRGDFDITDIGDLCLFLSSAKARKITGKLISVKWDNWVAWSDNIEALTNSDLYTLRRIVGRDRGVSWGDK
jgi:NAD(P)-dependent dehydrogenase (short-subunit alcohol dehydrogenase family)